MSIAITSLSNKDGEPISLPGGGVDDNPASEKRYSVANYLPHIPLRDIPDIEFPPCDKFAAFIFIFVSHFLIFIFSVNDTQNIKMLFEID